MTLSIIALTQGWQRSSKAVNQGIENAVNLKRLLEVMMVDVLNSHAEAASSHEKSLEVVSRRTESQMEAIMTMVAVTATSTTALQNQIVSHQHHPIHRGICTDNLAGARAIPGSGVGAQAGQFGTCECYTHTHTHTMN